MFKENRCFLEAINNGKNKRVINKVYLYLPIIHLYRTRRHCACAVPIDSHNTFLVLSIPYKIYKNIY